MKTETTSTDATTATTRVPKTAGITLRAGDSIMRLLAVRKADGTVTTSVTTSDGDKKPVRGMTQQHPTMDAATAALSGLATEAEKKGWARPAPRRGFVAKPDAFSTLPAAPKVKK